MLFFFIFFSVSHHSSPHSIDLLNLGFIWCVIKWLRWVFFFFISFIHRGFAANFHPVGMFVCVFSMFKRLILSHFVDVITFFRVLNQIPFSWFLYKIQSDLCENICRSHKRRTHTKSYFIRQSHLRFRPFYMRYIINKFIFCIAECWRWCWWWWKWFDVACDSINYVIVMILIKDACPHMHAARTHRHPTLKAKWSKTSIVSTLFL